MTEQETREELEQKLIEAKRFEKDQLAKFSLEDLQWFWTMYV